ncbi:MAG: hypothetical protein DMG15_14210 [Acidobacteria bacterium]|nr:MAG: hypothetical protein DMG15_14210 [Acidobacteriota bacterium]
MNPKAYNKTWTFQLSARLAADTEMMEAVCNFSAVGDQVFRHRTVLPVHPGRPWHRDPRR